MSDKEGSSVLAENVRPRETPLLVNITAAAGAFAFGLWGLAVKLSSILGPVTYGLASWISRGDHRLAMLITGSYFLIGLVILIGVDAERGRAAALSPSYDPESGY